MSPVFAHGQLRLYLLALLADGPRHGYEIMRGLEERFDGLYSPSAGTVYPRLAKLEEEGLVRRTDEGRKATYALTDQGYAEVSARSGDLGDLEDDLDRSAQQLAAQVRARVSGRSKDLRAELKEAARQARQQATPISTDRAHHGRTDEQLDVERLAQEVRATARRIVRDRRVEEQVVGQVRDLLAQTLSVLEGLSRR
ncbi:helix-turn-helix transcriptional regulator [Calidifontibacter sp. DB0510]|uniref:Helix-turn-helix transcriptional regulator n=1 Tax=Metallococcus carri TaxID=1656884 RepID=A0A967B1S0_9MICO|nr:PadR family transcriptional regulator [Metallococcus carri]NHN56409.1 helix-turn-helix transcriptional regulator [Metallococcus carri]NOP36033.1 helix-turn-helix transcriptional regulator [Calidifontibacter sp. DB2511S]